MHAAKRLPRTGAVDADGHILEPPDLWERYLEPEYRDRALRIVPDENGLEELSIGGARSHMSRRGFPSTPILSYITGPFRKATAKKKQSMRANRKWAFTKAMGWS